MKRASVWPESLRGVPWLAAGIYRLVNRNTGEQYIGASEHLRDRLQGHYRLLVRGIHRNLLLQRSYDEGGLDFEIVQYAEGRENLLTIERQYIAREKPTLNPPPPVLGWACPTYAAGMLRSGHKRRIADALETTVDALRAGKRKAKR